MITKERLKELIKEEKYVYDTWGGELKYMKPDEDYLELGQRYLNKMFEAEKDAKWDLEMSRTRTETLKLPTWENIKNLKDKTIISFYAKDITEGVINVHIFRGFFNVEGEYRVYLYDELTEENYIKACELCLKLFDGEVI